MPLTESTEEEVEVTSAAAWKRPIKSFVVELPSGNTARIIRKLNFFNMLKEGRIPNNLAEIINGMIADKRAGNGADTTRIGTDDVGELLKFIDVMLVDIMVEPRFVLAPEGFEAKVEWTCPADAITSEDLTDEDKFYLFGVALGGATDLEQFRAEQREIMATASNGVEVLPDAKPVSRSGRPLPGVVS